jgi:glutathione peroxidase
MKNLLLIMILLTAINQGTAQEEKTLHDFTVESIDGKEIDLSTFKGKKVLVVNTASKCGFTPQYEILQKLYEEYGGENFEIIGFPANNFLRQEPGTNEEIKEFCSVNYGVTFPMMAKISVKGKNQHPLYAWLTKKSQNTVMDSKVKWNFQKYLIDEDGRLVTMVSPRTSPTNDTIVSWIKAK